MGWPGLVIDEAYDGLGLSCIDLAMILGEMGRTLAPSPFLGTLFGAWAIQKGGSDDRRRLCCPASPPARPSSPWPSPRRAARSTVPAARRTARKQGESWRLTGAKSFVIDAAAADWLVVAAQEEQRTAPSSSSSSQPGVQVDLLPWRDVTRQVADVRLKDAVGERLAADDAVLWPWLRDRVLFALATESAAGAQRVMEMTVDYAKERTAFGKPIGSYQAIKHSLADMLGQVECCNAATLYAAWALSENDARGSLAAAMAKAYTSDAYMAVSQRSIQIFGAIGFTWEMVNHLYFKRARANAELFGSARAQRARVIDMVEKKAA